jgi:acetyl-CoA/propionyl-CoA carboxylase biotin carboxyl carrier protein
VRLDSGVESGSSVPGTFDSMMAKLIVTGATREQAIARARRALAEFQIDGIASVLPFHRAVMDHADFTGPERFAVHTRWIETDFAEQITLAPRALPVAGDAVLRTFIEIDGKRHELGLPSALLQGLAPLGGSAQAAPQTAAPAAEEGLVAAPISGNLHAWLVEDGAQVKAGEVIAVMEAMKMETQISAPADGTLRIREQAGAYLDAGAALAKLEG